MKTRIHGAAPLLALATCLVAAPAHAEETDATIIVTAPTATDAAEVRAAATPGGTDVVSYKDYADKSVVSLRDTLAFSPGIYLQPRYGQEVRISIRGSGLSRGFHMRGLTLLQDGVPINLADDNGDFQELEPIFFDHLQVYRGANALRFGSGTLGGAINGVTPTGRTAGGVYLRGDVGSFDSVRGLVSAGVATDRVDAWGAISADRSDGDRDHAQRRSLRFQGNVGMKLSDVVSTRFYASINHIKQQLPGALTMGEALTTPRKANAGAVAGDQGRDIDSLRLQNRTTFDWGVLTLDVGGFVNAKSLHHPIFQLIDQKSVDIGSFFRADYASGPVELTFGGEIRRGSTDARQFVNSGGRRGALTFDADQKAQTATLYGEVRVRPVAALSLIAGGVYADGWRKRQVNFSTTPATDGRIDFDAFSPKFGLLFEPSADIQIFANYSRSAEFPGFGEVFQTIGTPPTSSVVSDIRPQRAWTAEIGTRGKLGFASWDLALYRSTLKGELLQFTVNPNIPAATFNADRTLHQGVEAGLDLAPTNWLRLRQVYTYSDFRFRDDAQFGDNRLPVVPKHAYRAELRLGSDALHIAPNLEWVPDGPFADYRNQVRTPGYALIGVTGGATIAQGIDAFVDVRNITGKKAIGDISAAINVTPASAIYYPVERRAVSAGVRARF
ncbi:MULTISPECIES: TonB-dependent receptor domain-containing protein [unclassified Sphingopyxis]|jgi:iron complex outermembrane receptor protein|uniref:TonB-dependent receptor family protein n=1 Tax=unclassified Sphingopyxis TaxID=2614943 RepID=UPI0006C3287E|nr:MULTISPECIES: TonB-dependent receptor [unclassified Sphingopyxis]USI76221.1 TonB-dependent receptor [Sphingopyxis sp. USTB-05]GAO77072.1 tonB-dependent receptor [Sphingopyxis sp. C-1]